MESLHAAEAWGLLVGTSLYLQHSCSWGGRLVVLPWVRRGTEEDCPACPDPSLCLRWQPIWETAGRVQDGSRGGAAGPGPGHQLSGGGWGVALSEGDVREWTGRNMEMLLQRGEWKGEELCVSECVSQTVLAVAIQCGPYCLWVCLGGAEYRA